MSTERTRRNAHPSAKQKAIDAGKRASAIAKQPKPPRNAPEQVQKRREAGSGLFTSNTLGVVKPVIRSRTAAVNSSQVQPARRSLTTHPGHQHFSPDTSQPAYNGKENRRPTLNVRPSNNSVDDIFEQESIVPRQRLRRRTPSPSRSDNNNAPDPRGPPTSPSYDDEEQQELLDDPGANDDEEDMRSGSEEPRGDLEPSDDGSDNLGDDGLDDDDPAGDGNNNSKEDEDTGTSTRRKHSRNSERESSPSPPAKVQRLVNLKHDGRPRRKDFDEESRLVIDLACSIYEALLASECIFPDAATEARFVKKAWADACTEVEVNFDIASDVHKLITRCGTHLRSGCKSTARMVVAQDYGFNTGQNSRVKNQNIALAAKLKDDNSFTRPLSQLDKPKEERSGLYRHKAIGQFLNVALFNDKTAIGVTQSAYFGSAMPKAAMAFSLVMLEFGIREWESGTFCSTKFYEHEWRKPYFDHLTDLKNFEKAMQKVDAFNIIAGKLLTNARAHAGVGPVGKDNHPGRVSVRTLEAELRVYEDNGVVDYSDDDSPFMPAATQGAAGPVP